MTHQDRIAPIVAISQRIDKFSEIGEIRDAIDQKLVCWVLSCGGLPYPVPNMLVSLAPSDFGKTSLLNNWLTNVSPDAIILSGGNDIGLEPNRDATEIALLEWAAAHRVPLLGICRGMQMMAHHAGAKLFPLKAHVRQRHNLVSEFQDWPGEVNSYHNWGILDCPPGYEQLAVAQDGTLEAFRHIKLPWEGWMWHPERETKFSVQDINRLKRLFYEK